jgi:MFS family permease
MVFAAPLAGLLADHWGIRPALLLAAGIFAIVAAGLALSSFRTIRATGTGTFVA